MLTPLSFPVCLGMGSSISQVPQLQQHADPAARLPQPALLPPWDLLGECPAVAQPAWPSPSCPILTPSCCLSLQCCRRTLRKQLDHNLTFHKLVGYALALLTGTPWTGTGQQWGLGAARW